MKKILALIFIFTLLFCSIGNAKPITFSWNPNTESDLAGYRLYQTAISGQYTLGDGGHIAEIPAGTEIVNVEVAEGTWYWVLTAYDFSGNESGASNEVDESPGAPGFLKLSGVNTLTWDGDGNQFIVYRNSSYYKTAYINTVRISGRHKQRYYFEVESVYGRSERFYVKFYGWKGREV